MVLLSVTALMKALSLTYAKQFIRGKPISFGFKLWSITSFEGYLFHAEPYCGLDTDFSDTGLG